MTEIEYIKRKNAMIFKHTGVTLVPPDQIEDCEQKPLSIEGDAYACPYCKAYYLPTGNCEGCPMAKAGNECDISDNNTYNQVRDAVITSRIISKAAPWHDELKELIEQYNRELE